MFIIPHNLLGTVHLRHFKQTSAAHELVKVTVSMSFFSRICIQWSLWNNDAYIVTYIVLFRKMVIILQDFLICFMTQAICFQMTKTLLHMVNILTHATI